MSLCHTSLEKAIEAVGPDAPHGRRLQVIGRSRGGKGPGQRGERLNVAVAYLANGHVLVHFSPPPMIQTESPGDGSPFQLTRARRGARIGMYAAGLAGLVLLVGLVLHSGLDDVLRVLDVGGWKLLLLIPFHLLPIATDAGGWRVLLRGERRATFPYLAWAAVVRDSANGLLPVARVGGEALGVRLVMLRGVPGSRAGASVIVEITVTLAVQLLFTLAGLVLLYTFLGDHAAARTLLIGLIVSVPAVAIFFLLQHRWGLFQLLEKGLSSLAGRDVLRAVGEPEHLDRAIRDMYGRRAAIGACAFFQTAGLLLGAAELWFALYLLGHPPTLLAAILLESLAQAVQNAAFMVPGNLGVQEGSFLLFGAAVGLSPETALALSLTRRLRLLGLGLPALASWQWVEGRHLRRLLRWGKDYHRPAK